MSETELRAALDDGTFTETPHREAKRQERTAAKQAADMASFAIDGGLIVIGVAEEPPGTFKLAPIEYKPQIEETPDRIAHSRCDPPLQVRVDFLDAEKLSPEGKRCGYLLIEIPASADAPHQVDGVYYGRVDKGKHPLSDAQVERLISARTASLSTIDNRLSHIMANPPRVPQVWSPLHIVARPTRPVSEMFLAWTGEGAWATALQGLTRDVAEDNSLEGVQKRQQRSRSAGITECRHASRTAGGAQITAVQLGMAFGVDPRSERIDLRICVLEDGEVSLFDVPTVLLDDESGDNTPLLFDGRLTERTREFARLLFNLSTQAGYGGAWDIAIGLGNLQGAMSQSVKQHMIYMEGSYDRPEYCRSARFSAIELENAGRVTKKLVGPLLRSMGSDRVLGPFFDD